MSAQLKTRSSAEVNPIRKVVTLLQNMQIKVTAEGEKEKELFDKFMCYCKTSGETLAKTIEESKAKIEQLEASIAALKEGKARTEGSLEADKKARAEAKEAMAKATALREKEAAAFAAESSDLSTNLAALSKAIPAIEKGMAGAFLQTTAASALKSFVMEKADLPDASREELLSFLSGGDSNSYAPQSGEIVGILKMIQDEMSASLKTAKEDEAAAISTYESLMAAKKKEVDALSKHIEEQLLRNGDEGVELATLENDLEDTQETLKADEGFLAQLDSGCDTKAKEWEAIKATRAQELIALADTIKLLNDDDALELFKKTLPSVASFLQVKVGAATVKANALAVLRKIPSSLNIDLLELAMNGQGGFDKVIKMIDEMVATLKKEQTDDDAKKEYCELEFDTSDDKKKGLEQKIKDEETAIAELEGSIATLTDEIAALTASVKALDKSVADATEQRKTENAAYKELMASDTAAKELIKLAINRLNKFYNPKIYLPPPKRELSDTESITISMGGTLAPTNPPGGISGTGITAFVQVSKKSVVAPPPPPATFDGYKKKTESSFGVIQMMDLLIADLDKEMQSETVDEKDAQAEYEKLMADAAAKRAEDTKSITDKEASKASEEEALQATKDSKAGSTKELMATLEYIKSLHGECDWLMKYFSVRKEARTSEIEALGKAKDVLSGADYSLVQLSSSKGFLSAH
jgi:septal ring factor EnvC (AmiA/AmiB activator)